MSDPTVADTRRLNSKPQDLTDAYGPPSNFLEMDVYDPQTVGVGRNRFTTYEVRMRTNLPIFKLKDSIVRRRYSDFEWLKNELERDSKIVVPPLPGKALKRQLPFRGDEGIFEDAFIEERRVGLEQFINRSPSGPKRALSSHVFAGREHRPQLRSRKVMERPSDHVTQLFGLQIQ
ncbi:sorting nexin-12-like isoform 1-T1 [Salvelinus alpinus]|uniref:sorting nexin-12 isoform X1 n=1 Tax=Salvelinus sp. IW2-2015 TaxID=2691554 RepID=UPI0038D4EBAB